MKYFHFLTLNLLLLLFSCSDKGSILSTKVEKDPGDLKILNSESFMGATIAGTSFDHEIVIKANGGLTLKDLSVTITTSDPITFKGGSFPGTGGTCASTLESGKTCTIVLEYAPQNTNSHLATLMFNYKDDIKNYGFNYQVSADSYPILSYDFGSEFNFGNKFVGSTTELRVKVKNRGRVVARNITINNLSLPFAFKGGSYPGSGGSCGSSISPGQDCEIYITYSPVAIGSHNQVVTLNYLNAGRSESNSLQLKGTGVQEAKLTLTANDGYDFGAAFNGIEYYKTFTLSHSGGVKVTSIIIQDLLNPYSVVNKYCGTTLETGSCTFQIKLNSSTSGTWINNFNVSYNTGIKMETISKTLNAVSRKRAKLTITPTGAVNFGVIASTTADPSLKTFTVNYDEGEVPATILGFQTLSSPFAYTAGSPPWGGTCGSTINSGSCTIKVSYLPSSIGGSTNSAYFKYNDGLNEISSNPINLSGKTENKLYWYFTDLGNVVLNETKLHDVRIHTFGSASALSDLTFSITSPFVMESNSTSSPCQTTLNAGSSCYKRISVKPTDTNLKNGTLTVSYFDGIKTTSQDIPLTIKVTSTASLSFQEIGPIDFGDRSRNSVTERIIAVTNSSEKEATSVVVTPPAGYRVKHNSFNGLGSNCGPTIQKGNCNLYLEFNPTALQTYTGPLKLTYFNGSISDSVSINLTGTGIATDNLFLVPDTNDDFSITNIGNIPERKYTLYHGGGSTARTVSSKSLSPATDFEISNDLCPVGRELVNGSSCTFSVKFKPTTITPRTSTLTVIDGTANLSVSRVLSGTGRGAVLSVSPSSYDFGNRPTDDTYSQNISVTNNGDRNATSFSSFQTGVLGIDNSNCGTLVPGGTCQIMASFSPTTAVDQEVIRTFNFFNGYNTVSQSILLKGTGINTAILSFTPASTDFGDIIRTQGMTKEITVVNTGQIKATGLQATPLTDPFSFVGGSYPGTGGTCGTELDPGSCKMVVRFSPTDTGIKTASLGLSYNNGSVDRNKSSALTGKGITQAILTISETNPFNMGTTSLNNTLFKEFIVKNVGDYRAVITGSSFLPLDQTVFNYKGNAFPGSDTISKCVLNGNLLPQASCLITLTFKPTEAKQYSVFYQLNYQDGLGDQVESKVLTGTGSSALQAKHYLSLLERPGYETEEVQETLVSDINKNDSEDVLLRSATHLKALDGLDDSLIFGMRYQFSQKYLEGLQAVRLLEDRNNDGLYDLLLSIHKKERFSPELVGYVIRCARTGNIIETFNKHTPAQDLRDSF